MSKIKFLTLFVSVAFLYFPLFSFAQSDQSTLIQQLQKQVEELTKQIQALQQQLGTVQSELGAPVLTPNLDVGRLSDEIPATETTSTETPPEFTKTLSRGSSGDEVRKLQEFLKKDKEIYPDGLITGYFGPKTEEALKKWQKKHNIEQIGILGPQSRARFLELGHGRIKELITEGAPTAVGGIIPPGLEKKISTSTTTTTIPATTTPPSTATTTPKIPPRPGTCEASNAYCINSDECSKNGYYWCRNSCYTTESACLGQVFIAPTIPAVPATPAQPTAQTGATTVPATPAIPAVPAIIATSTTAGGDTTSPSVPTGLVASNTSPDIPIYIRVSWTASTDNVGVVAYRVYRNGIQVGSVTGTVYDNPAGLVAGTTYSYTVAAYDAAGNVSAQSNAVSATTLVVQTITTTPNAYGSSLNLSGISTSELLSWLGYSTSDYNHNGIILGGGLTFSFGVTGGLKSFGGRNVANFSLVDTNYFKYITQSFPLDASAYVWNWTSSSVDTGSVVEIWDVDSLKVVATNINSLGSSTVFTAQPNHRYGGFAWYADNSNKQLTILTKKLATQTTTTTTDTTPPSVPTGLTATSYSPYGITLTWNKSTDNVGVVGYKLYRNGTQILSEATSSSISTIYFTDGVGFGLTPSTTYSYTVAAYDATGNTSAQSSAVSATTLPAEPLAPTNIDGATSGNATSQPPRIGLYLVWNYALQSTTKSFNVYMKKPSDAAFVKYTYDANTSVVPGWLPLPEGTTPKLYHNETNKWMWRIYDQIADTVWEMGEYKFYVTATDTSGVESVPTATKSFKFYRAPTIVSPANGSTVSVTPRITITEDPASVSLGLALYQQTSNWVNVPGWWPAPRDFTYNGPALTTSGNPYRLVAYSVGGFNERSLNAVSIFNVATTTSSINSDTASRLAQILESLNGILNSLKLLR